MELNKELYALRLNSMSEEEMLYERELCIQKAVFYTHPDIDQPQQAKCFNQRVELINKCLKLMRLLDEGN